MQNCRENLNNYLKLKTRVDGLCRRMATEYAESLACREGCSDCCRHISLFPVEAFALASALDDLHAEEASHIRSRALAASNSAACPLLEEGRCLLYAARPIICRTHGFPLLAGRDEKKMIDFCPKNFAGITTFPAAFVLDLDLLNATLATINAVFTASCSGSGSDRLTIAEALMMKV